MLNVYICCIISLAVQSDADDDGGGGSSGKVK